MTRLLLVFDDRPGGPEGVELYEIEPKQVRKFVEHARTVIDEMEAGEFSGLLMPEIADFARKPRGRVEAIQCLQDDLNRYAEGDSGAPSAKNLKRDLAKLARKAER